MKNNKKCTMSKKNWYFTYILFYITNFSWLVYGTKIKFQQFEVYFMILFIIYLTKNFLFYIFIFLISKSLNPELVPILFNREHFIIKKSTQIKLQKKKCKIFFLFSSHLLSTFPPSPIHTHSHRKVFFYIILKPSLKIIH